MKANVGIRDILHVVMLLYILCAE